MSVSGFRLSVLVVAFALGLAEAAHALPTRFDFLGEARIPTGFGFEGTEVGGLSGLVYDAGREVYYAQCDDGSGKDAAHYTRFYTLRIAIEDGALDPGDVTVAGVTPELDKTGSRFAPESLDPEGIALGPGDRLFFSSEGKSEKQIPAFIRELDLAGRPRGRFVLPEWFRPSADGKAGVQRSGVQKNLGFEALAVSPDGRWLWSATENALAQDGPQATLEHGSPARLERWDLATRRLAAEHVYWTGPLAANPDPPGGLKVTGLVDLIALGDSHLLALERGYAEGKGFRLRLFLVAVAGADDVAARPSLADGLASLRPVQKTLLFDFADLATPLDNVEGMTFGPPLPDGRRTLLFISDNNFNPIEVTQIFAFAVSEEAQTIPRLQGAAHRSPAAGSWVAGVEGVVTALAAKDAGFWMQDPAGDGDPATSDGIFVATTASLARPDAPVRAGDRAQVGDRVRVGGRVEEVGKPGDLPVTTLRAASIEVLSSGNPLPPPVLLDQGGVLPPGPAIDDDGLTAFEPASDALDFFESLEGMRLALAKMRVVGPTDEHGGFVVLPDSTGALTTSTIHRGVLGGAGRPNPQRILVDTSLLAPPVPSFAVGERLEGDLEGVLDDRFGGYRLLATTLTVSSSPTGTPSGPETTGLGSTPGALTVATFNLENLGGDASEERLQATARMIVENLAAPDLLALQEIQDDSAATDDGTVTAGKTLARLLAAIEAAGGPRYEARQIDPLDKQEGGQPGGNIRPVVLARPDRLRFVDRGPVAGGSAGPNDAVAVATPSPGSGPHLSLSPGRVTPADPCFAGDPAAGYEPSRRPLAVELKAGEAPLFVIANHFASKSHDDRLFGSRQPPQAKSRAQHLCQAERVGTVVAALLAADPRAQVIVLGDLNEEASEPLAPLAAAGLVDLTLRLPEAERYSHVFEGNAELLDHLLVSPSLAPGAEIDIVHANADFPAGTRASDHDPVLARLRVPPLRAPRAKAP